MPWGSLACRPRLCPAEEEEEEPAGPPPRDGQPVGQPVGQAVGQPVGRNDPGAPTVRGFYFLTLQCTR